MFEAMRAPSGGQPLLVVWAEPEAAEVPNWSEGSAGDRFSEGSRMKEYALAPRR
jgi:hypothetical protein